MTNTTLCEEIAKGYGVSLSDFLLWNPSLQNKSPCTLDSGAQYCVQSNSPKDANVTEHCVNREFAEPGEKCEKFAMRYAPLVDFLAWNPVLGGSCANWKTGE
jgi:hypothetical protein